MAQDNRSDLARLERAGWKPTNTPTSDRPHADFPATESGLEFIMERIAALPTRWELAWLALVILLVGAVLGIVGIEAFWRYIPACGS
jgi:hypothetical protein